MADQHEPTRAEFDLDAWIDGTTGITGVARIVQRGDLLAARDRLETELETTKKIPAADRGVADRTPQQIEAELDQVYEQVWSSMLWVHVQDRTLDRRRKLAEKLREQGTPEEHIGDHLMADAIVAVETADGTKRELDEDGFGGDRLVKLRQKAGDAALHDLQRVFREVVAEAPAVSAPLSRGSSSTSGGTTSKSRSGRRGSGASRRGSS